MQNHWFEVPPYRFHYVTAGCPKNFPLLFLHGFLGDCRELATIMVGLEQNFYCLAIDLPGHGLTQVEGDDYFFSMEKTAIALIQFLEALKIGSCGLIGYSMGGRLALHLGLHFPVYFSGIILESASPGLKTEAEKERRRRWEQTWIDLLTPQYGLCREKDGSAILQNFLHYWYQQPLFESLRNNPLFPQLLTQRSQNKPEGLAKSLQYMGTGNQLSLWPRLNQGKVSLYLLVGQQDHKFIAINQEILTLYSQANLSIFENCGHNLHLENPCQFIVEIQIFFDLVLPNFP